MDINRIKKEDIGKGSNIKLNVCETEVDMYWKVAIEVLEIIEENNKKGEPTVMVIPYGPLGPYSRIVHLVNKYRVSLKNCVFINMDEYLTDDDETIDYNNILSFHQTMDRMLYSKIDKDLLMPQEQRLFPNPGQEKEIDELIESLGKVDLCLTGVGINGHIAFNESASPEDDITDEEFRNLGTRCLNIARETIINNGANKIRGALDIFPKRCVTLGMKQLLSARVFKVYLYCNWQWGIARKISLEEASRFAPASFLQQHPDSEMVITRDLYEFML